jgi:hypothetical protein
MAMNLEAINFRSVMRWAENNGRTVKMVVVTAILAVVYLVFFSGALQKNEMVVVHRFNAERNQLVFNLGTKYDIRKIEFVTVQENGKSGEVLWGLEPGIPENVEREETLAPFNTFQYGRRVRGMKPTTEGRPPRLTPGTQYRLVVVAKGVRGEYDFSLPEDRPAVTRRR